jgi:hypothetical protein
MILGRHRLIAWVTLQGVPDRYTVSANTSRPVAVMTIISHRYRTALLRDVADKVQNRADPFSCLAELPRQPGQFLFAGRKGSDRHLTTRQYARLLDGWITEIGLDPKLYGTHSLRRTKATLIYKRTGNLRAVQLLLGHTRSRVPCGIWGRADGLHLGRPARQAALSDARDVNLAFYGTCLVGVCPECAPFRAVLEKAMSELCFATSECPFRSRAEASMPIEKGKIADPARQMQGAANCPDLLQPKRRFAPISL